MTETSKFPIEHVIVLMLENHSYDHMLGYLSHGSGLTGNESNPLNPLDPSSEQVRVSHTSEYITPIGPAHDYESVERQLYGDPDKIVDPAPMSGFVASQIIEAKGDVEIGKQIMECFDPVKIPALTTLALEFCVCDHWFSAVPGPTWVNRFFVHAATADGVIIDTIEHDYRMKTIFDSLEAAGHSWAVYYGDIPQSIILQHHLNSLDKFKRFEEFYEAVKQGKLANYTFIEPRFLNFHEFKANDQHPPHDIRLGEYLIAEIYDTLRSSALWEKSLFIVLYDEHGGYYDHVPPPGPVPSPDGKRSSNPEFDFTRLGLRVPAVLVSPYIEKGVVDSTVYEHSSIPATLKTLFNLPNFLTERDKAAHTFEKALNRTTPRSDTPLKLPVPGEVEESQIQRERLRTSSLEKWQQGDVDSTQVSDEPLTDFQKSLVDLAHWLNLKTLAKIPAALILTEHEAAIRIHEVLGLILRK